MHNAQFFPKFPGYIPYLDARARVHGKLFLRIFRRFRKFLEKILIFSHFWSKMDKTRILREFLAASAIQWTPASKIKQSLLRELFHLFASPLKQISCSALQHDTVVFDRTMFMLTYRKRFFISNSIDKLPGWDFNKNQATDKATFEAEIAENSTISFVFAYFFVKNVCLRLKNSQKLSNF